MINKIVIVRHGMRLDFEDPVWYKTASRKHDPPLSETGIKQAKETSYFLNGTDMDHLFSSPFYRTLQTADIISKTIDLKIKVEHGFSEYMNSQWFEKRPEILNTGQVFQEFDTVDKEYQSTVYPEFPEDKGKLKVYARTKELLDKIDDTYKGTILIVGHGATVSEVGNVLLGTNDKMNFGVCGINIIERKNHNWILTHASNDHLSIKKEESKKRFR